MVERPETQNGVECAIPELGLAERGIGDSRRAGEQAAAAAVLTLLKAKKT